jgi:hypothetical protein
LERTKLPRATEDLVSRTTQRKDLPGIPIIAESDFLALLEKGKWKPASAARQVAAIELTAAANSPVALGVAGRIEQDVQVKGDVFLVARDPMLTTRGDVQSKSFYVGAMQLSGRVAWAATNPSLLLAGEPDQKLVGEFQGCAPITGRGGVPEGIVLNLESGARPANASSELIELQMPCGAHPPARNRFVCAGSVRIDTRSTRPSEAAELPSVKSTLEFPAGAVVISEADFYRILQKKSDIKISPEAKAAAARIITAAGDPSALGIQAQFVEGKEFSTSFVVVARDPKIKGTTLTARQFYMAPIDFAGTAGWLGERVTLGFGGDLPTVDLDTSLCGPRVTMQREPNCELGMCIEGSHPWIGSGFGIGGPEPGQNKPTIRLFELGRGRLDINAIACTQYLAPPERQPYVCGTLTGGLGPEICNGRDDDCNGVIDDGGVCDTVPMHCPAQPRTCGAVTCGDLPDGCGGVLHCGGPCQ